MRDAPDDGIAGVTITFGGAAEPVTTDAEGLWSRDGLTGTVTVTPEHDEYIFEPDSQPVTKAMTNVNFGAELGFVASGTITDDDDDPIEGVVVDFGGARASVTTDVDGKWRRTGLSGEVTVTAADPAYDFTPGTVSDADPMHDFQGEMQACSTGTVTGTGDNIGGLVGTNNSGHVSRSYSTSSVTGGNSVGGLIGENYNNNGVIEDSYALGDVEGQAQVGGLVGLNWKQVIRSFSAGAVEAAGNVGGLIGENYLDGEAIDSYWDTKTSGQDVSAGREEGRTTEQMKNPNDQTTFVNWDEDVWEHRDGEYPDLIANPRMD